MQIPYLENLNEPQKTAVLTTEGPLLILAGAGTGKTKVLISRIAHLVTTQKAWPAEILAVTFTNKAAQEMRERIEHLLGLSTKGLWIGTFHSISARILRTYAHLVGLSESFTILDSDEQLRLIRQILGSQYMDDRKENAKKFLYSIEKFKDRALLPKDIPGTGATAEEKSYQQIYSLYQERLKTLNAVDFSDLLLHTLTIFRTHPEVCERFQNQFKYIMVDEYQDTNVLQYLWLRILASSHGNLCCVGDDDQSIYGWRGAEIENILKFERDFKDAVVVRLEQNYRSTHHILSAASSLIAHNRNRMGKTLWTDKEGGYKISIKSVWDGAEEARWVGEEAEHLAQQKVSLKKIAILVRAGFQTRNFEECFMTMGIPFLIVGGFRFYDRQEIKDALSYLRLTLTPQDSLAFERIINTPKRGVGPGTLQKIHALSREHQISLLDAATTMLHQGLMKGNAAKSLKELLDQLQRWRQELDVKSPSEVLQIILEESGYIEMWKKDPSTDGPSRVENLKELVVALREFPDLPTFIEHVSLVMERSNRMGEDAVNIMTMHSAKGLEFDYVFLVGWEEGIFPSQSPSKFDEALEEERRLAYVGLTRAKKRAHISFAMNRLYFGQWNSNPPSRFLKELPSENIEILPSAFQRYKPAAPFFQAVEIEAPRESPGGFQTGERVFHIKFGYGTIRGVLESRLDIFFDHSGMKTILEQFIKKVS